MKTTILLGAGTLACALAWAAKDPAIMTVNGVDVPKSEFEYLYHKNSQQQLAPQPLEEYVEMFKNYRLKVADALAAGIDTTASFRQEMEQYRSDLAAPYMTDSVYLDKLVREAYDRSQREVESSHIMLFKARDAAENERSRHYLDSIRGAIMAGEDFADDARKFSQDRGSSMRGGSLGYITAGRFPYSYEVAAFSLQPGEISEVIESPVGYHILKGGESRPARGEVLASHIMKMAPADDPQADAKAKASIDSIYALILQRPGAFEELAMRESDDPGSARQGGKLPWFGSGQMVQEFDSVAFALPIGQISAPFRTRFGWHIVYKIDSRTAPALEEMRASEIKKISNPQDERYALMRRHQTEMLAKKHKASLDMPAIEKIKLGLIVNGLDSLFYAEYSEPAARAAVIGRIDKTPLTAGELIDNLFGATQPEPAIAEKLFDDNTELFFHKRLCRAEEDLLEQSNADYRNLLHEYINGSLLYEASVRNVWDKASKDEEGLKNYFETHRDDYKWLEPRAKGILVQAQNDSVAELVQKRFAELPAPEALPTIRREFKGKISADRVLATNGQNAMIDNLMFGGPAATPPNSSYKTFFMIDGKVIDAPEDFTDVRGQVTSDYQEQLEKQWLDALRAKYPITVNQKVLKKVK